MSVNPQNKRVNVASFGDLHKAYHDRLLNTMTGLVRDRQAAEEITSSAFAKALEHLATFRGDASFYTWLQAIARNEVREYWDRNRALSLDSITGPTPAALIVCDSATDEERSADRRRLQEALRRIPPHYRRLLKDHYVRGYSTRQIARKERIPLGTVLSRIFTAKKLLRRAWGVAR